MNVKLKKQAIFVVTLLFCFSVSQTVFAASENDQAIAALNGSISPRWSDTAAVNAYLEFDGSLAICSAYVLGYSGTNYITATVVLSRRNSNGTYTTINTWSNLYASGSYLGFDDYYYVSSGYIYRLSITAVVYRNGSYEVVNNYYENYAS